MLQGRKIYTFHSIYTIFKCMEIVYFRSRFLPHKYGKQTWHKLKNKYCVSENPVLNIEIKFLALELKRI